MIRIKLRLYPDRDDDLILFFERLPYRGRAYSVKRALRDGIVSDDAIADGDESLFDALAAFVD